MNRIQCLSTRETTGVHIIKSLTGRDSELVCDPTLLIDKKYWDELAREKPFVSREYIFCYFLGNNPQHRVSLIDLRPRQAMDCGIATFG